MNDKATSLRCHFQLTVNLSNGTSFDAELVGEPNQLAKHMQFIADGTHMMHGEHVTSFAITAVVIRNEQE